MISLLFFLGCHKNINVKNDHILIGSIDAIEGVTCVMQTNNEKLIYVNSKLCLFLKEGDIIKVVR